MDHIQVSEIALIRYRLFMDRPLSPYFHVTLQFRSDPLNRIEFDLQKSRLLMKDRQHLFDEYVMQRFTTISLSE